jgi:hypothetical protein
MVILLGLSAVILSRRECEKKRVFTELFSIQALL